MSASQMGVLQTLYRPLDVPAEELVDALASTGQAVNCIAYAGVMFSKLRRQFKDGKNPEFLGLFGWKEMSKAFKLYKEVKNVDLYVSLETLVEAAVSEAVSVDAAARMRKNHEKMIVDAHRDALAASRLQAMQSVMELDTASANSVFTIAESMCDDDDEVARERISGLRKDVEAAHSV
jgi:hypothetical protein